MEWRDNEGVPQLVFGEELSIGEGLEKARVVRAIIFLWSQGVELIFARRILLILKLSNRAKRIVLFVSNFFCKLLLKKRTNFEFEN